MRVEGVEMKRLLPVLAMISVSGVLALAQNGRTPDVLFKAAQHTEQVQGDLKTAIAQYQKVVDAGNRALAAQALIRIAECHQKLGDAEASKVYQRIVRDYADQADAIAVARARLLGSADHTAAERGIALRKIWDGEISGTVSRDGRRLSYTDWNGGATAVHDLVDGTNRAVSPADYNIEGSAISRDGTQVAYGWFTGTGRMELRLASALGGPTSSRRLFASEDVSDITPMDWSPDGNTIAVFLHRADQSGQIALMTVPEGSLRVLKSVDWRGPTRIFFSPDGRQIGFDVPVTESSDERDVFVLAIDGSREVAAVVHPGQDVMMGWSPDGNYLLFASDRREGSMGLWVLPFAAGKPAGAPELVKASLGTGWSLGVSSGGALYLGMRAGNADVAVAPIDLETGKQTGPPVRPIQRFVGANTHPHWSPDGRRLAYVSSRSFNPSNNRDRIIAIQSLDTGDIRELPLKLPYFNQFTWSPDGRGLFIGANDSKGRGGVFRIDVQTGDVAPVVMLGNSGFNAYPQPSPDGSRLYYRKLVREGERAGDDGFNVTERQLSTGQEREVVGTGFGLAPINLSPDGRWTVLVKLSGQAQTIMLVPIDGGQPREMLRAAAPDTFARYQGAMWTADSRGFIVRKRRSLNGGELWYVPLGGEPRKLAVDLSQWATGIVGAFSLHPDGHRVAFLQNSGDPTTQVWVLENFLPKAKQSMSVR
jgi:Tol biopolymer transport system component